MILSALIASLWFRTPDRIIADFESRDYGSWKVEGSAFGLAPAKGTLPNQMAVSGYQGESLANSYHGGDDSKGKLTSPEFKITHRWISFLIGGGFSPENLALQLIVDGKIVRSATGPNKVPGGSEALHQEGWEVSEFIGKNAVLQIVDNASGGWGHINVDHIVLTDQKPSMPLFSQTKVITIEKRYLVLPIKNSAASKKVTLQIEGGFEALHDIQLADGDPDWSAILDVSRHKGRRIKLTIDVLPDGSKALEDVSQSDTIPHGDSLYKEPLRGQFHFSARRGWLNDPNGLVFYKGEYHLFFQHNPFGWSWGNMHWGHATSKDLIHWTEHPIALFPDEMGTMFSGSAVVDWQNTSGFGKAGSPPMVLFYTAAGSQFTQGIAHSIDGRSFEKFTKNPIVGQMEKGDRDPKVIWHEPTKSWVMVLYLEIPNKPTIQFLTSPDLKKWTPTSRIEGYHECPDLFELPVDGQPGVSKWVLTGANSDYQVGTFDGKVFTPETKILKGHQGRGFYAAQTFSDVPNRRIQIGWFQTETKGMPFNQSMSIPMDLGLVSTLHGPRLCWKPVQELNSLRTNLISLEPIELKPEHGNVIETFEAELADILIDFQPSKNSLLDLNVRGTSIQYDSESEELIVAGNRIKAPLESGRMDIRVLCDRIGLEVFAAKGNVFVPWPTAPQAQNLRFSLRSAKGTVLVRDFKAYSLRSAWQ